MSTPKPTTPFYWTKPCDPGEAGVYVAPSGWYQWTREGLKYLGESILTPLTSEQEKK